MKTTTLSRSRARGQILVLGCLAMLMLATMVLISFNVTNAIHEKIRLQSHADAQAFSVATLQARAFNQMAYTNRSIAAAVVAEMAVHSWFAIASEEISLLKAGETSFYEVAALEFLQCPKFNIQHCIHGFKALRIARKYRSKASDYKDELDGKESDFNDTIESLTNLMKNINKEQNGILDGTLKEVSGAGSQVLKALTDKNAPMAKYKPAIHALNARELACTVEGSSFDSMCTSMAGKSARSKADKGVRSNVMESAANAIRPDFERGKTTAAALTSSDWLIPFFNPQISQDIQGEGLYVYYWDVKSRVGDTSYSEDAQNSEEAKNVGAHAKNSGLFVQWKDGFGGAMIGSDVYSDANGGKHKWKAGFGSQSHGGSNHDKFKGIWQEDPCQDSVCFINFRASSSKDDDFGMPSGYGAVGQDLRVGRDNKKSAAELNDKGTVKVKLSDSASMEINMVARGEGFAVGKAKAYFHQPGDWQVAPNFFDPFWKAKLHPFSRKEIKEVLTLAGDMNGVMLVSAGGPVEGDTR